MTSLMTIQVGLLFVGAAVVITLAAYNIAKSLDRVADALNELRRQQ